MREKNKLRDAIKNLYKPYRYTINGNTTILETTSGKFIAKEKTDVDIKGIYNYLLSRNFDNFPALVDGDRTPLNVFEYVESIPTPREQKAVDLINVVATLHNKTTYHKEVSEDKYKEIYENITNNLVYLEEFYNNLFSKITTQVYMSPSNYLLIRNSTMILSAIDFCKRELDIWYKLVKEKKKQRVAVIHNNLASDHLIKGMRDYLVSWDKSKIDSPVMDLINFYKNDYYELDFETLFDQYLQGFPLLEDEQKLFFIVLSIPPEIEDATSEFRWAMNTQKCLDYVYKTESLIRPYYTTQKEEE